MATALDPDSYNGGFLTVSGNPNSSCATFNTKVIFIDPPDMPNEAGASHTLVIDRGSIRPYLVPAYLQYMSVAASDFQFYFDEVATDVASFDYSKKDYNVKVVVSARILGLLDGQADYMSFICDYSVGNGYKPGWEHKKGHVLISVASPYSFEPGDSSDICSPPVTYENVVGAAGYQRADALYPVVASLPASSAQIRFTVDPATGGGAASTTLRYVMVDDVNPGVVVSAAYHGGVFANSPTSCRRVRIAVPPTAVPYPTQNLTPYRELIIAWKFEQFNITSGLWELLTSGVATLQQQVLKSGYGFDVYKAPQRTSTCVNCGMYCPQAYDMVNGDRDDDCPTGPGSCNSPRGAWRTPVFGCGEAAYEASYTIMCTADMSYIVPGMDAGAGGIASAAPAMTLSGASGVGAALLRANGGDIEAYYAAPQYKYVGWGWSSGPYSDFYTVTQLFYRHGSWPSIYSIGVGCTIHMYNTIYATISADMHAREPGLPYYTESGFQNGYYPR